MMRNLRFAAVHLALVAMVLRALLPADWMPSSAAGSPLVICTMDGPVRILLGADGKPLKQQPLQDDARHHEMCPFAAAPHLASPASTASIAPAANVDFVEQNASRLPVAGGVTRHSPQSPRAPPVSA